MVAQPLVVAWGMGVNSTALLVGMKERGVRPDLILAADTGGEKPETYAYVEVFQRWLQEVGFTAVIVVRRKPYAEGGAAKGARTLEEHCLNTGALPSVVYGWKTCSEQWKRRAQNAYCADWPPAVACWEAGQKVRKAIGYDAAEPQRASIPEDTRYVYEYPLLEWGWYREDCVAAVRRAGLPVPPKSACFFCPSSKKSEVLWLYKNHPDLFARAVAMERNAEDYNQSVKGLGRRWSWGELVSLPLFDQAGLHDPPDLPCGCFDGDEDEEAT